MDFSDLVSATLEDDQKRLNEIHKELFPVLVNYLSGSVNCSHSDAEDCVQQAILNTIEKIKAGKIRSPQSVFPYIMKTCRNNYFRFVKHYSRMISEEDFPYLTQPEDTLLKLMEDEEDIIVNECVDSLSESLRKFMRYHIERPGVDSEQVAYEFGTTVAAVWSKRYRIIQLLGECVKLKQK